MSMKTHSKLLHIAIFMLMFWNMELVQGQEYAFTEGGVVEGITLTTRKGKNITAFLGIPYAKPPVGQLRFKNPVAAEPWEDVLVANTDGKKCPQLGDSGEVVGDEDCLYLNVYTQTIKTEGKCKQIKFGFGYLLDMNIVMVALTYRLGALGFLSTGDRYAPGNFGLKDQVFALKWAKENIEAFGGDRNRVTLFGQDAGGASANLHGLSNASNGLFHRYISQSGTALCPWAFTFTHFIEKYTKNAEKLGEKLDCPITNSKVLIDCLREKDTESLVSASNIIDESDFLKNWGPTDEPDLNGAFLTEYPVYEISRKNYYRAIIGHVADEGLLFTAKLYSNDDAYKKLIENFDAFLMYVTSTYLVIDEEVERYATLVKQFYFDKVSPSDKDTFLKNVTNLLSDVGFLIPANDLTQRMENVVYYYSFNYRGTFSKTSTGSNENEGINHGDDLNYLLPASEDQLQLGLNGSDEEMIDIMVDLWTSFASTGIPSTRRFSDPNFWPRYTNNNTEYLRIGHKADTTLEGLDKFNLERYNFWSSLLNLQFSI